MALDAPCERVFWPPGQTVTPGSCQEEGDEEKEEES